MTRRLFFVLLLSAAAFLSSCTDPDPIEPSASATFGIRHDRSLSEYEAAVLSPGDHPDYTAVVMFSYTIDGKKNDEYIGSGTLIAPQWILTAGHNFYVAEEQKSPAKASDITVYVGNDPNNPDQTLQVEQLIFHPTWMQDNQDFVYANDLCLVKLKTPVTSLTPVPLFIGSAEPVGSTVWFCGFGDYSSLSGQNPNAYSKKHAVENVLDRKSEGIKTQINGVSYSGGLLAFDFDSPDESMNSLGDNEIGEDEALLGPGSSSATPLNREGTTVQGDSGGPLFVKDGNSWKLAGVLSGGVPEPFPGSKDSSYGDISVFIRVSSQMSWIQSVVK